jgi:hypothetical protein
MTDQDQEKDVEETTEEEEVIAKLELSEKEDASAVEKEVISR